MISIYIKTDIIHNLFQENTTLDYNKLELFHLQYTDSLIELLTKIKRQKENDMLAVINEIDINNKYISGFEERRVDSFETDRKMYSGIFSQHLKTVYKDLTEDIFTANWDNVLYFHKKYAQEFYRTDVDESLLKTGNFPAYQYKDYSIERKLLGRLNIQSFKVRFVCGYLIGTHDYELFKIFQSDDYFVFSVDERKLYLFDKDLDQLDISENQSNQTTIIDQLKRKNEQLESSMNERKRIVPPEVEGVLKDYLRNLENIDIMSKIFDFNEETNILRAMLNLNLNNN
ncbi:hypothetical protein [Chryseobacterium indologenes]|uniref:hypothetical protein n=1 Tax=Chryseobacterium indologenes TaxID=253 RepID=UPI000F4F8227|nr:hypothetical protein [Chryseobacterium indologenes]MBF6645934.1 hypothetical protein [Chryseobacterium indologenes]MBU3049705.1 hypothetical protein [Chryseobacterium indologenes]MEB4760980.1 hypothetical protein [Chryseobacterium indologenes]QQQ70403.1 hypothetical protein JHW31_18235 [Chryseobacterium indologenes]